MDLQRLTSINQITFINKSSQIEAFKQPSSEGMDKI